MICSLLKALYPTSPTKVDGFCKAISALKHSNADTIMAIAEEWLADVAAPESWGKGLSAYDVLRHKLLLGDAEKFLIVYGSLSGIQDYLFDVKSSHALKQLRGRSFYLYLLQDAVVERAMRKFGTTRQSVLYSTGGTFCMLIPYAEGIEERFKEFKNEITDSVFDAHQQNLILLTCKVATLEELGANLSEVFSVLHKQKNVEKHTPLCGKMQDMYSKLFAPQESRNDDGINRTTEELGAVLGKVKYILVSTQPVDASALAEVEPAGLGVVYYLLSASQLKSINADAATQSLIIYNDAELPNVQIGCRREYLAGIGASAQSFADLLENTLEMGVNRLGVLRMDVDNLGNALRKCYDQNNALAHYAKMSRSLDLFFKKELDKMWHKDYKDASVIVYSGGDDLFIMGEWSRVLDFAHEINKQYKIFFAGKDITISGGLSLVKEKFPIVRAAEYSADEESRAKNFTYTGSNGVCHQKSALSIFNTPLRWDVEWPVVNDIYNRLSSLIVKQEQEYRPIIRRILKYYDIVRFKNKQITPLRQVWLMTYDLDRAIKRLGNAIKSEDKEFITQCKNDIVTGVTMLGKSIDTPYHSLQLWAVAARLVELTIRKKQ